MGDIVATIRSLEQDRIIRASDKGLLVVQGGPDADRLRSQLHRIAYLLCAHRGAPWSTRGVLLVGPSSLFLRTTLSRFFRP